MNWSEERQFIASFRRAFLIGAGSHAGPSLGQLQSFIAGSATGLDDRSVELVAILRDSGLLGDEDWARVREELREALRFMAEPSRTATNDGEGHRLRNIDADPRNADWLKSAAASRLAGYRLPRGAGLWLWRLGRDRGPMFWSNVGAAAERFGCAPVS